MEVPWGHVMEENKTQILLTDGLRHILVQA